MLLDQITSALKEAVRNKDVVRRGTMRLILTAVKDRQIQLRGEDGADELDDAGIAAILQRMIKQRQDSADAYEKGGRAELADRERQEIVIIREFLPTPLTEDEVVEAIRAAIRSTGAKGIRDMGRVVATLKAMYPGRIDIARASRAIKAALI